MLSKKDFEHRIESIVGGHFRGGRLQFDIQCKTKDEARLRLVQIRQMEKELRLVKKDLNVTIKAVRSPFIQKKAKVGTGLGSLLSVGVFGKKTTGRMNTLERERLRAAQINAVAPYESLSRLMDSLLVQLDSAKIRLEAFANAP